MRTRFLRYRIDRYSVGVGAAIAALQCFLFFTGSNSVVLLCVLLVAMRWTHIVEHNHVHLPFFISRWLSELFGWVLMSSTGLAPELYRIHHVDIHHRFENGPEDWTSPFVYGDDPSVPPRAIGCARYVLVFPIRGWSKSVSLILRKRGTSEYAAWIRSSAVMCTLLVAGSIWDPRALLCWYIVPWVVYFFAAGLANWRHHDPDVHDAERPVTNDATGPLSGALGFNIGYHSAHHWYPDAHWSELPNRIASRY